MSEAPLVTQLSATVSTGQGIESVQIGIAVNTAPSATLNLGALTQDPVVEPLTSEVLAEISEYQTARLAGVTKPNITLNANDGVYGSMAMEGYVSAPMLEISNAHIGRQFAVLDKVSMLDGLDLSIYDAVVAALRQAEVPEDIPISKDGNVTALLLQLTNHLVSKFELALSKESDPVMKDILRMRHDLNNSGPLDIWRAILTKSSVVHKSWADAISSHHMTGRHISVKTMEMLTTKSSGFWNVMNKLMAAFQMYYVPDPKPGSYGQFYGNKDKIDVVDGELELDITNLNVRDGSARILQVGGVIMKAGSAPAMRQGELGKATTPGIAGVFPDPIKKGYIHEEIPPIWLVDSQGATVIGSSIDEKKDKKPNDEPPNLNIPAYLIRREDGKKFLKENESKRGSIMTELCEHAYKDLMLADSTISARLPLNLTIEVGKRKTLKMGDAGSVTGFIQQVNHHIDLRQGKELDSFSQITITHVLY